jgi:hypothetical protein
MTLILAHNIKSLEGQNGLTWTQLLRGSETKTIVGGAASDFPPA